MTTADIALRADAEPGDLGFSAERLARIDRHFERYVEDGRLAGWLVLASRAGQVAHLSMAGRRDLESGAPVEVDTLWRIYSMTKPVTTVAAMMLWEEGAFELKDPVARYIPAFTDARVYLRGSAQKPLTEPVIEPIRIWHLMTHTSGLTYGFHHAHAVDAIYRAHGFEWSTPPGLDLAACCDVWAGLPLAFQPGREWNYSVATDVLGRIVELLSGQSLDAFFAERIFAPLGMRDTAFHVGPDEAWRLAALYSPNPQTGRAARNDEMGTAILRPPDMLSGSCPRRPTTTASPRCCCARASSAGCGSSGRAPCAICAATTCPGAPTSRRSAARCSPRRRSRASASAWASRSSRTRCPATR